MNIRRRIGNTFGLFFLVSLATTNLYVSDPSAIKSGFELAYHIFELLLLAIPLLIPLVLVEKYNTVRKISIVSLCLGTLSFSFRQFANLLWALQSGELLQKIMFPVLTIVFISVLVSQYFELSK